MELEVCHLKDTDLHCRQACGNSSNSWVMAPSHIEHSCGATLLFKRFWENMPILWPQSPNCWKESWGKPGVWTPCLGHGQGHLQHHLGLALAIEVIPSGSLHTPDMHEKKYTLLSALLPKACVKREGQEPRPLSLCEPLLPAAWKEGICCHSPALHGPFHEVCSLCTSPGVRLTQLQLPAPGPLCCPRRPREGVWISKFADFRQSDPH